MNDDSETKAVPAPDEPAEPEQAQQPAQDGPAPSEPQSLAERALAAMKNMGKMPPAGSGFVYPADLEPGMRVLLTDGEIREEDMIQGTRDELGADASDESGQYRLVTAVGEGKDWMVVRSYVHPESGWAAKIDLSTRFALSVLPPAAQKMPGVPQGLDLSISDLQCEIPAAYLEENMRFRRWGTLTSWLRVCGRPELQGDSYLVLFSVGGNTPSLVLIRAAEQVTVRSFDTADLITEGEDPDGEWTACEVRWLLKGMDIRIARWHGEPGAATLMSVTRMADVAGQAAALDRSLLVLADGNALVLPGVTDVNVTRESYWAARRNARTRPQEFTHWALPGSLDGSRAGQAACGASDRVPLSVDLTFEPDKAAVTCCWCRDYLRRTESIKASARDNFISGISYPALEPAVQKKLLADIAPGDHHLSNGVLDRVWCTGDQGDYGPPSAKTCVPCQQAWAADWAQRHPDVMLSHQSGLLPTCLMLDRSPRPVKNEPTVISGVTCPWCSARMRTAEAATKEWEATAPGAQTAEEPVVTNAEYKEDRARWEGLTAGLSAALEAERTRSSRLASLARDMLDGARGGASGLRLVTVSQLDLWEKALEAALVRPGEYRDPSGIILPQHPVAGILLPDPTGGDDHPLFLRLYLTESEIEPGVWMADCRADENGWGSPMVWSDKEAAEKLVQEEAEATGCYGTRRLVELAVAARLEPPSRCETCGEWGHEETQHLTD